MAFQIKTLIRLAPAALLIVAFQNCAPQKFSQTTAASEKSLVDDGTSSDDPADSSDPSDPSKHTHDGDCDDDKKSDDGGKKSDDGGKKSDDTGKKSDDGGKKSDDTGKKGDDKYNGYRAACQDLAKDGVKIAANRDIKSGLSSVSYVAESFGKVEAGLSRISLGCSKDGGKVEKVKAGLSLIVLCGCDVDEIDAGLGTVIVVGGDVGNVKAGLSNIIVVDGEIKGDIKAGLSTVKTK